MSLQIYYYTRTGRSKTVAEVIANKYYEGIKEITDNEKWNGPLGFLKGGAKAARKDQVSITYPKLNDEDDIVLVFPVWAGTFPPAVRMFLDENPCRDKMILMPTSLGTKLKDREGFKQIIDLVGKDIMEALSLQKDDF